MTTVIEASQNMYECFKSNYATLKNSFCDPPPQHKEIKDSLTSIKSASVNINRVAKLLKNVPRVGTVAKTVMRITDKINPRAQQVLDQMERQNKQDKGKSSNGDCCPPFPASGCSSSPGWLYKCGACSSGEICMSQRACNTLVKLEQKLDKFKEDYYDPLVEKVAEAAQNVQAGNNLVQGDSVLEVCGLKNCADLKKLATSLKNTMDAGFHDKVCPLKISPIQVPSLGPLVTIGDIFGKINGFLQSLLDILAKVHCVDYLRTEAWSDWECITVYTPCCSGWNFWSSCSTCGHSVCSWVPKTHTYWDEYCFSAQDVLDFVSGLLATIFGPIMSVIDAALRPILDKILEPINKLFDQMFGHLKINFPAFPNLALFDITLPQIPSLKVSIPSYSFRRRYLPSINLAHPTCNWLRQKAR